MDHEYLGPYKIDRVLGKGGMGTVYFAHHSKSGDPVAVKVIAEAIATQERFRRRFDAEIETLKRLTNKCIVKLIGYGEEKGLLFYSMEYVDGENLHDRVKRDGRLSWEIVLKYAIDVCSALKHAHDIGVIHRDIKPSNLLIDTHDTIKMTDFGIAKLYGGSDETVMGSVLGTADFMPPEQAEGTRVTARSDLYSLGAVMYACLCGRSPHYAKSTPETLYNVRYKIPEPLIDRVPNLPSELGILVGELLQKDPKQRPPTALVVWNRLAAMQAGLNRMQEQSARTSTGSGKTQISADQSMDLGQIDPSLADEFNREQTQGNQTRLVGGSTKSDGLRPHQTKGTDLTLASEELLAASHYGQTTNVATHLTSLTGEQESPRTSTRFTTVDEDAPRTSRRTTVGDEDKSTWGNITSIAILSIAIVGCIAGMFYASRRPSADDLYRVVQAAVDDASSLDQIDAALADFKTNYPDDERLKEFNAYEVEIEMERKINRLARRIRMQGNGAVAPLELSFVEAMQLRDQQPSESIARLQDIATVFEDRTLLSPDQRELVDYANQELQRLQKSQTVLTESENKLLLEQFAWAKNLDTTARIKFYKSLIELYSDKLFAKTIVAEARAELKKLEGS
jgi:serine/threonine protein kinase